MATKQITAGNVDIIFSEHFLSTGHTYYVRVNSDTSNPRIEKVFREIKTKKENDQKKNSFLAIFLLTMFETMLKYPYVCQKANINRQ